MTLDELEAQAEQLKRCIRLEKSEAQVRIDRLETMLKATQAAIARCRHTSKRDYIVWSKIEEQWIAEQHAEHFRPTMSRKERSRATQIVTDLFFVHFPDTKRSEKSIGVRLSRLSTGR